MDHTWQSWIDTYLLMLAAANASAGTVRLRRHYLTRLAERFPQGPEVLGIDELTAFQATPGWSAETRKSARSGVRGFFGWAYATGRIPADPSRLLPEVRVPQGVPRPVPEAVLARALLAAGPREELMLRLGAHLGLRRSEIAGLHSDDLVGEELFVRGKGGRVRRVPCSLAVVAALGQLPQGWVFPAPSGGHLSADWVGRVLRRQLGHGWSAHTLRHRFASRAYAAERDLFAVQELLGHSKPETTRRYTEVPAGALVAAVRAAAA